MNHSISHFLSGHFPDLAHPWYQSTLQKIGFVFVTATIIGLLIAALAIVLFSLA
jgi:hypothetical protein